MRNKHNILTYRMYVITPILQRSAGMSSIFPFNVSGAILNHTQLISLKLVPEKITLATGRVTV